MDANEYQRLAARTLLEEPERGLSPQEHMVTWNVLGLVGEAALLYEQSRDPHSCAVLMHAGLIAEWTKKAIFHEEGQALPGVRVNLWEVLTELERAAALWRVMPEKLCKKMGDVLWYGAALASKFGWPLAEFLPDVGSLEGIMVSNIEKLAERFPGEGWTVADAQRRADQVAGSTY